MIIYLTSKFKCYNIQTFKIYLKYERTLNISIHKKKVFSYVNKTTKCFLRIDYTKEKKRHYFIKINNASVSNFYPF